MSDVIDYYFSIGSPWAWFGLRRLRSLAQQHSLRIEPRATGLLTENGAIPGRERLPVRQAYNARDIERTAAHLGYRVRIRERPALDDPSPAARAVVAVALDGGDWAGLAAALHEAFWAEAQNIADPDIRAEIATRAGFDGAALLRREAEEDVTARIAGDRDRGRDAGVFGSPSYVYDGEIYWGQDRLDHLEAHLASGRPLAG